MVFILSTIKSIVNYNALVVPRFTPNGVAVNDG